MINDINMMAEKYSGMITAISHRMIENKTLAKDAAQEAWTEIMTSFPKFKGESQISTWMYTIATRTILRYSRKERQYSVRHIREYLNGDEIEYPNPIELNEKEWVNDMCDKCITGSIHCLTNKERLIYLLYDVAGLNSQEIAGVLSASDLSIRKTMSRSRKKLHSFLNDQCILYNPEGNCKCRMVNHVKKINIQKEFQKIQGDIREISFLRQCDQLLLSNQSFLMNLCHSYPFSSTNNGNVK